MLGAELASRLRNGRKNRSLVDEEVAYILRMAIEEL